jgi:aspartate kinase
VIQQTIPPLVVQKYGGSSLSTLDKVRAVARRVVRSAEGGRRVVVVVSAMGDTTSQLVERARALSSSPPRRELDVLLSSGERMSMALLAMAIEAEGRRAISLTGPQCGIVTDEVHADASILEVRPDRVLQELERGHVVIVAGYQGLSTAGEVTTLGRGGSDTTAAALAGALGAAHCEICSDVPGVYSADPRTVKEPMHLRQVDARLMTEYARRGARVLHPACIELALRHRVPVHARATFGDDLHTVIAADADLEFSRPAGTPAEGRPTVVGVTSRKRRLRLRAPAASSAPLQQALDLVASQDEPLVERTDAAHDFLLDLEDLPDTEEVAARVRERLRGEAEVTAGLASVSMVAGDARSPELQERVVTALRGAGVPIHSTYRRRLSITCAIDARHREDAVRAVHECLVEEPLAVTV